MIDRDGRVKVADFGIARAVAEAQMTLPGTTLGSVHYFSPEQARGDQATPSSDIYSLGIVLFELLTGRRPWEADTRRRRRDGPAVRPAAGPHRRSAPGIPADLVAIDRKALAHASPPIAGPSAVVDGRRARGVPRRHGRAGDGRGGGGRRASPAPPPITSATARANPNAIPYAPDAYAHPARRPRGPPPPLPSPIDTDDEDRGTPMGVWAAGIAALAILAIAGFLVFRLLSGPGGTIGPGPSQVAVPNFVGLTLLEAQALANQSGLTVAPTASPAPSGVEPNTVIAQDPPAGGSIDPGGTVKLTVAAGPETVAVPDLRNKTETDAFNLLAAAGLQIGTKTEAFDPVVPAGQVVTQNPPAGVVVNKGTPIDYTLSKGPEPSASPSPSPTPTPDADADAHARLRRRPRRRRWSRSPTTAA